MTATQLAPPRHATPRRSWPPATLAALAAILLGSLTHQWWYGTLAEDAYISLRYSAQLLAGNGLVFNPGEPVEGYSNFLWVLLVAAGGLVWDNLVDVARALGVLSALAAVALTAVLTRRVSGDAWAGVAAAALAAASGPVAAYGPSALETPLFAALLVGLLYAVHADRPVVAGSVLAAATMTRPDGAVIGLVLVSWLLVCRRWRLTGVLVAAAAVPGVVWTVWRVAYYGHLLPNPIAAKSGMDVGWQVQSGVAYLAGFVGAAWPLLLLAAAGTVLAAARPAVPGVRAVAGLLVALCVVYGGFFVYAGGDWMPAYRFYAPVVPLLAVLAGLGVAALRGAGARGVGAAVVGAVCALSVWTSATHPQMIDRIRLWETQVVELANIGAWLNRTLPEGTVVGAFANGALSYHAADLVMVDLLGLTDEHIAREGDRDPFGFVGHAASDWAYVVEQRRPAVIHDYGSGWLTGPSCGIRPEFAAGYVPLLFQPAPGKWSAVLVRNDVVASVGPLLAGDGEYVPVPCP